MKIKRNLWYITIIVSVLTFGIFIFLLLRNYNEQKTVNMNKTSLSDNQINTSQSDYAFETCYTGEPHLSDKLFQVPFRKSDLYICNKDLLLAIGEENSEVLTKKAQLIAEILFDTPYKEKVSDSTVDELSKYFSNGIIIRSKEGQEYKGRVETAKAINQWFVNSKTTMESSLQTDKCMVYYDEHCIIARGLLTYTVYESENLDELKKIFAQDDMQYGKKYSCLLEFYFIPDESKNDYESYLLSSIIAL